MKKRILILFISFCPLMLMAANPGFGTRKYEVTGMVEYSYNTTWGHHANFDVQALMPINPHFEMEAVRRHNSCCRPWIPHGLCVGDDRFFLPCDG